MVGQTILVSGGAGCFGTHTVVQLLNEGFKVSIIDNHVNCVNEAFVLRNWWVLSFLRILNLIR